MIKNNKTFKVGDKIINFNRAFKIFKISKQKNKDNGAEVISFRPYFQVKERRVLTFSIPVDSIDKTNIRKPISKQEVRELLAELAKKVPGEKPLNIAKTKEELILNDPNIRLKIIKCLWQEKNNNQANFTKCKEDILELAIKILLEEVALVYGITLEKADKKIRMALKRSE